MTFEASKEENKYAKLTKLWSRNTNIKRAKILDKKDLTEKYLHHSFIERLRYDHKLPLTLIDWSFIEESPVLKQGKAICDNFIDGHLYPDGLCSGLTG